MIAETLVSNKFSLRILFSSKKDISLFDAISKEAAFCISIFLNIFALRNSGDGTTGNRVLGAFGMATIYFSGDSVGYISGAGLS